MFCEKNYTFCGFVFFGYMNWTTFLTVFTAIFVAELGDKTQLATMLFAADKQVNPWQVFFAAALALVLTSAMGVLLGSLFSRYLSEKLLQMISGILFMAIGAYSLYRAFYS